MRENSRTNVLERREFAVTALGDTHFDRGWLSGRFDRIVFALSFFALTYYSNQIGQKYHSYWLVVGVGAAILIVTLSVIGLFDRLKLESKPENDEKKEDGGVNRYLSLAFISALVAGLMYVIYAGYRDAATGQDYTLAGWSGAIYAGTVSEILTRLSNRRSQTVEMQQ